MALSLSHRRSIRTSLIPVLGEEETDALLTEFPGGPDDQPVTVTALRHELAVIRTEMADLRTELRTEMADLRTELRVEMADLRVEVHKGFRQATAWGIGALLGAMTVSTTVATLVSRAVGP